MTRANKSARVFIFMAAILALFGYIVHAGSNDPIGPKSISVVDSQRIDEWDGYMVVAEAGNVSYLNINATSVTKHWAGFYGNITGYISLSDASNWTLYDWKVAEPQGKIYATPQNPPTWGSIDCLNYTSGYNNTELEDTLDIAEWHEDGVNETFCPGCGTGKDNQQHPEFFVGYKKFSMNDCWMTYMYTSGATQSTDWIEVLLQDGVGAVYMAIIEDDQPNMKGKKTGFDGKQYDFQMIVGENGNGTAALSTTPYYFYVELQ